MAVTIGRRLGDARVGCHQEITVLHDQRPSGTAPSSANGLLATAPTPQRGKSFTEDGFRARFFKLTRELERKE